MGRTASPALALYVLLAVCGAVLLASPWASGGNIASVDAARPHEAFDVRLLAGLK